MTPPQLVIVSVLLGLAAGASQAQHLPPPAAQQWQTPAYSYGPAQQQQSDCLLLLERPAASAGLHAPATICIGQQDVEQALAEAAASLAAVQTAPDSAAAQSTSERPKPIEVVAAANLVTETTRILAAKFQLSEAEVLFQLPAIDAGRSPGLARVCPSFLRDRQQTAAGGECLPDDQPEGHFRSLSGFCNNQREAAWGSARSAMVRFLAPSYQDAVSRPRLAADGTPLPSARVVSFVVHQDPAECDLRHSMLAVVWGQFMNHDVNLGARITEEDERLRELNCCASGAHLDHPDCLPIEIPKGDPFFGYFQQKCMHFVRLAAGLQPGCPLGPVQAMNKQSSYLDGSSIYGSSAATLRRLRAFRGGLMRSQPVPLAPLDYPAAGDGSSASQPDELYPPADPLQRLAGAQAQGPLFKDLLPANELAPDVGCERRGRPEHLFCFDAGDSRANEQIQLASLHTIFMREHNRLARELAALNPHWQDGRLFEEARKLVVAQLQHISYAELLPVVVGRQRVQELGLELARPGHFYRHYSPQVNAGVRVEFQAAAFRFGHSLVPGHVDRFNRFHQKIESVRLSKLLKQPFDLYFPGVLDTYVQGLVDQRAGRMDPALSTELTNHLFERPGNFFGLDLAAINIQRGREMGVRGYNDYRQLCGLARALHFDQLAGSMSNKTLLRLAQLYRHVDDIDLFTGGLAEFPLHPDALVGPTFSCLIAKQAAALRDGDRFWYENPGQFSIGQLDEIRKQTAARLLCDNADQLDDIQPAAMLMASHANPRLPCAQLPAIDLSEWRERPAAAPAHSPDYDGAQGPAPLSRPLAQDRNHLADLVDAVQPPESPPPPQATHSSHFVDHLVEVGRGSDASARAA